MPESTSSEKKGSEWQGKTSGSGKYQDTNTAMKDKVNSGWNKQSLEDVKKQAAKDYQNSSSNKVDQKVDKNMTGEGQANRRF
jgi:hypothetical protein